jgi:cytochrome c553
MLHGKKFAVVLSLAGLMVIAMAATRPALRPLDDDDKPKRHLKVLPKDISHEDLDKVMKNWATALGVKCNFCHAPSQDSTSHRLDFASDAKPEKEIARHMFKMTGKINKKYFSFNKNDQGVVVPAITCVTCHRGNPHPEEK